MVEEAVPAKRLQAIELVPDRGEAFRQRDQMRDEDSLELDVGFEANPLQQVREEVLVGVVRKPLAQEGQVEVRLDGQRDVERHRARRPLEGEVPHASSCPRGERLLAKHQGRRAQELTAYILGRVLFDAN